MLGTGSSPFSGCAVHVSFSKKTRTWADDLSSTEWCMLSWPRTGSDSLLGIMGVYFLLLSQSSLGRKPRHVSRLRNWLGWSLIWRPWEGIHFWAHQLSAEPSFVQKQIWEPRLPAALGWGSLTALRGHWPSLIEDGPPVFKASSKECSWDPSYLSNIFFSRGFQPL